jgi:hypothetical protein
LPLSLLSMLDQNVGVAIDLEGDVLDFVHSEFSSIRAGKLGICGLSECFGICFFCIRGYRPSCLTVQVGRFWLL